VLRNGVMVAALLAAGLVASAARAEGESSAPLVHFVDMDEISVPIVDGSRVDGTLHVKLVIDAANADAASRLSENLPALRQAALSASLEFARLQASAFAPVDVSALDAALTGAISAVDKAGSHVLIVEVSARRE